MEMEFSIKNWRNKQQQQHQLVNDKLTIFDDDSNLDDGARPQQPNGQSTEETFSLSMYTLVGLTLIVFMLFLNWYRKGRNNIRTRRKYFLLNMLGI